MAALFLKLPLVSGQFEFVLSPAHFGRREMDFEVAAEQAVAGMTITAKKVLHIIYKGWVNGLSNKRKVLRGYLHAAVKAESKQMLDSESLV